MQTRGEHQGVDALLSFYGDGGAEMQGKGGGAMVAHVEGGVASGVCVYSAGLLKGEGYLSRFHVFVVENEEKMAATENDLRQLLTEYVIFSFPPLTNSRSNSAEILQNEALLDLAHTHGKGRIWITTLAGLSQKVEDMEQQASSILHIQQGDRMEVEALLANLQSVGFELVEFVYTPGQFAKRGGILDIFSFGHASPFRIELVDDEVLTIRTFDPHTQLSEQKLSRLSILPAQDAPLEARKKVGLEKCFPKDTVFWVQHWEQCVDAYLTAYSKDEDPRSEQQARENIQRWEQVFHSSTVYAFGKKALGKPTYTIPLHQEPQLPFNKNFEMLIQNLSEYKQRGYTIFLSYTNEHQYERIQHILQDLRTEIEVQSIPFAIHSGFIDHTHRILLYTDHEIFNRYYRYKSKRVASGKEALDLKSIYQLKIGDYITHIDHGIGIFSGLQQIQVGGNKQEVIRILYKDNDALYVNIHSLHKISKYSAKEGASISLHKLGSEAWQKAKDQTKKRVKELAFDLIKLYAERKKINAYAHSEDHYLQNELEASFVYEETPDQAKAIEDVKRDMQQPIPMDRLICGDVGFGKTEVAIRATFKAVLDGKQVAVLVPTTILAMQHYHSFSKRMQAFSPRIEFINRFKTAKEKKQIKERLKAGEIDIIIGTQALLAKDIVYKDLSLFIIDEEQKFGVSDKEKLKNIRRNVDCLTLTATPIPRTLQLSLMGARDLSIINTPPANRQPPHTEILEFDHAKIKEIILYEVERNGQVFFIQNRIEGIMEMTSLLRAMCPQVAFEYAHGQLPGHELEEKMLDFINGKFDVLVATNIIESGLDISNANTIIINNAHQFGLSDLHQLRGRVGRSNQKSYCYLVSPSLPTLKENQRKKLEIIEAFSELGSGFQVAMKDLDIRGSGNILGAEQSGFMEDLGFDTYQRILAEVVHELKEETFKEELKDVKTDDFYSLMDCSFETDQSIFIPSWYISNANERMNYYKAIDEASSEADLETLAKRMRDIFGTLPEIMEEIFMVVRIRWMAAKLGFGRLVHQEQELLCFFPSRVSDTYFQGTIFSAILDYIKIKTKHISIKRGQKTTYLSIACIATVDDALRVLTAIWDYYLEENHLRLLPYDASFVHTPTE